MFKLIAAIVGGVVIAFAIVFATDAAFHAIMPSASQLPADTGDREAMRRYVASQPPGALAAVLAGWAIAAFAGSAVAARFGGRGQWPGWVVGGLFLIATASNFVMIPHPGWMVAVGIVAIVVAAWLGARAASPSARTTAASTH